MLLRSHLVPFQCSYSLDHVLHFSNLKVARGGRNRFRSPVHPATSATSRETSLQVACDGPTLRGRSGRIVRHHAAGLPVASQHHVGS